MRIIWEVALETRLQGKLEVKQLFNKFNNYFIKLNNYLRCCLSSLTFLCIFHAYLICIVLPVGEF